MHSLKHKKILVFGGSGFLGSHLLKRLPHASDTGVDITDQSAVFNLIKQGWDIIVNLAGISGTPINSRQIMVSFEVNVIGSLNLLEASRQLPHPPILFFSNSRQEYGRPQYLPVDELHPTHPTNLYGIHKLAVTHLAQLYHQTYDLPTIIFRTSNVYGKSPTNKPVNYNIVNQWLNAYGQIFNIGSGQGQSLLSMAKTIAKSTGAKIIKKPWPPDWQSVETGDYISDISKAKRILHWHPNEITT